MALTVANTSQQHQALSVGNLRGRLVTVTFDSSYVAEGEDFVPSDVGLAEFYVVVPSVNANNTTNDESFLVQYDYDNEKLRAFWQTDPGDAGGSDIPLVEVAGTTDLSDLEVRVLCIGA